MARGRVLLILVVDRVLRVAAILSRRESAAGRLFAFSLVVRWHRVSGCFALVPPAQVIVQEIRRGICLQIRRSAPPSRFIKHGLVPIVVSGTNAAPFTMFLAPDDLSAIRVQHLTADVRLVARQEHIARGNLIGLARAMHRRARAVAGHMFCLE